MAKVKEIRRKITSVQSTKKITSAMEMVAASKLRKAQDRMRLSKPYAKKIRETISHVANAHPEYDHPYLKEREIKTVGFIVVTTDRGLCGGLNVNLFKKLMTGMAEFNQQNVQIKLCVLGRKGMAFFNRIGGQVIGQADHLGDTPAVADLIGIVKVMLDEYDAGKLDALFIARNEFVNTMTQRPAIEQLLPIKPAADETAQRGHWDYLYEPDDAKVLLTTFLIRYIESQVYQAVVENIACQQAASMVAMKNASDNATKIISELKLKYNKARQAAITQEVCEIVAGADAIQA